MGWQTSAVPGLAMNYVCIMQLETWINLFNPRLETCHQNYNMALHTKGGSATQISVFEVGNAAPIILTKVSVVLFRSCYIFNLMFSIFTHSNCI